MRPTRAQIDVGKLFAAMQKDKKRTGTGLPLVMLTHGHAMTKIVDLGHRELVENVTELTRIVETPTEWIDAVWEKMLRLLETLWVS